MIIIADSGSTKADWTICDTQTGDSYIVPTMGFNPFFHNSDRIYNELSKEFVEQVPIDKIKKVFYYGAGCSDKMRCEIVAVALRRLLPGAEIFVEHDLLAAARATCGDDAGISCIMGTGSNTCCYDGVTVTDNVSNLGYLAGDEGSGSDLGRRWLQAYFYRELPPEIHSDFEAQFPDKRAILNKLYGDAPNVYLASFTRFIAAHKGHIYTHRLVADAFDNLIDRHIRKYHRHTEVPIHFIGSIAHYFQDILRVCLVTKGLKMGRVIKKPIDNLVAYHLRKEGVLV
jgi:glucosamine kinase